MLLLIRKHANPKQHACSAFVLLVFWDVMLFREASSTRRFEGSQCLLYSKRRELSMLRPVTEFLNLSRSAEITQNLMLCAYSYVCPSVCDMILANKLPHFSEVWRSCCIRQLSSAVDTLAVLLSSAVDTLAVLLSSAVDTLAVL